MEENPEQKSPLERWYEANRNDPDLESSLRLLLGHALVGIFRRSLPESAVFSPEKALSLVQRLPKGSVTPQMGDWISSPGRHARELLRFCENSGGVSLPRGILENLLSADGTVDLRGVGCPKSSVRARLVMRGLSAGEEVLFLVDDGEPVENVPRALLEEGEKVLFREKKCDYWKIRVRKGA